jgi:hypothetical protein
MGVYKGQLIIFVPKKRATNNIYTSTASYNEGYSYLSNYGDKW